MKVDTSQIHFTTTSTSHLLIKLNVLYVGKNGTDAGFEYSAAEDGNDVN
jgi:hypothetical protein